MANAAMNAGVQQAAGSPQRLGPAAPHSPIGGTFSKVVYQCVVKRGQRPLPQQSILAAEIEPLRRLDCVMEDRIRVVSWACPTLSSLSEIKSA
eukprot:2555512-Amphidinium_carterae.1